MLVLVQPALSEVEGSSSSSSSDRLPLAVRAHAKRLPSWALGPRRRTLRSEGGETPEWDGKVGFVPSVLEEIKPAAEGTMVITCGPPIMITFTLVALTQLGFPMHAVVTTLENRMKCGIGKCGRCNVGSKYVCKDGPVFLCSQLTDLPQEF